MSYMISKCQDHQFPMETIQRTDGEAQTPSSWTDEDDDEGTCASSPSVIFIGRRRCSHGCHRVWTPLPHVPGLGHGINPIPYPPQLNFPPPPHNGPHSIGGSPSSLLFASSTHCHPISTSPANNMSYHPTGTD